MQLEAVIASMITTRYPNENDWIAHLSPKEGCRLLDALANLRKGRDNPAAIEVTTFDQKIRLVTKIYPLGDAFKSEAHEVREMRNDVAHGHNYAENQDYLELFLRRLKWARHWIQELTARYL